VFEKPNDVKSRDSTVESKWKELSSLSAAKKKVLDEDLARELEKERLRMEFARLATEFIRYTTDAADEVTVAHFGFTLEEVEAFQAVISKSTTDIQTKLKTCTAEYEDIYKKGVYLGVKENIYTTSTPDSLTALEQTLRKALAERQAKYAKELERQVSNDNLCKEFATLADGFSKWIGEQKDIITNSKKDLEEQLKFVEERISSLDSDAKKFPPIVGLSEKMAKAEISNNKHTTLTLKDLEVQFEQYKAFLNIKKKMLEEEILHHKNRGITPEQFKEIADNFKQFDADHSKTINKQELKACLYSLGEEKSRSEVEAIMTKYGVSGEIPFENFKEFMMGVLGDSDTKDEIRNGFSLINKAKNPSNMENLSVLMNDYDLDYLKKNAPASGGGHDFDAWTESVFAR